MKSHFLLMESYNKDLYYYYYPVFSTHHLFMLCTIVVPK